MAQQGDVARVAAMSAQAFDPHFQENWSGYQMLDMLRNGDSWLLFAEDSSVPLTQRDQANVYSFALCRQIVDEVELLLCATSPTCRGKGLGRDMLQLVLAHCRARGAKYLFLEVRAKNKPALQLYEQAGFAETGRRKGYYRARNGDTEDAITLAMHVQ